MHFSNSLMLVNNKSVISSMLNKSFGLFTFDEVDVCCCCCFDVIGALCGCVRDDDAICDANEAVSGCGAGAITYFCLCGPLLVCV